MSLRVPHTFVLLFLLVVLAAAATHLLPAGEFDRVDTGGRRLVVPGSYHPVPARPAGVGDVFLAYPRGMVAVATIVFYIFIVGGAFGVVGATGAVDAGIRAVVHAAGGHGPLTLAALMLLFSLAGGTIGIAEETIPFVPALVLLARRLGYDATTGAAVALVGAGAGFSGAFLNPFTVGVGQGVAGLPPFSGLAYRLVAWTVVTAVAIAYVLRHAARVRQAVPEAEEPGPAAARVGARQLMVVATVLAALALVVVGAARWKWDLLEMAGLFVALAVVAGLVGGLGPDRTAETFLEGATAIAGGALVVGLARGVLVVLDGARVTDTILNALTSVVAGLPSEVTVVGIYAVQVLISYVVPSASGQAALSLPILAPLGDLVGVTRQTSVLAYQFGDGFSNILTPTSGYLMAALAVAGIPWSTWARFVAPLQLLWLAAGLVLLLVAHALRWGPF